MRDLERATVTLSDLDPLFLRVTTWRNRSHNLHRGVAFGVAARFVVYAELFTAGLVRTEPPGAAAHCAHCCVAMATKMAQMYAENNVLVVLERLLRLVN